MTNSKKKIMVAMPNMLSLHWGLTRQLFHYATQHNYQLQLSWSTERRHHDYARNEIVREFLKSECEWLLQIDADVEPNPNLLELTKYEKPVIAATVFCWIKDRLMPSVWQRADCEQCKCVKIWDEKGEIHDPSQYASDGPWLLRWNPFRNTFQQFYSRERHCYKENLKCRCQGTGKDPWVFRVAENVTEPVPPIKVDSVGSAAMLIRRDVLETVQFPPFRFLYKADRQILLTEDHYFCWLAACHGFDVWADQTMPCSHYKTLDLLALHNYIAEVYQTGIQEGMENAKKEMETAIVRPTEKDVAAFARN